MYNPTLNRTKRTVLAAPTAADGPATFRVLDKNDVGLGNVDNVAALPLTGGTMSGQIKRSINTSHIGARDGVPLSNPETGTSYRPVVGVKSANGYWVMSTYQNDNLRFAYTSDADYSAGTNRETTVLLPAEEGTIITTANIGEQTIGNANAASYISNQGNQTAINSPLDVKGLSVYQVYNNGYPTTYGNVLSIGGTGDGQILAGWSGDNNGIERLYYRNRRDMCST